MEATTSDVKLLVVVVLFADEAAFVVADDDLDAGHIACSFVPLDDAGGQGNTAWLLSPLYLQEENSSTSERGRNLSWNIRTPPGTINDRIRSKTFGTEK